MPLVHVIAPDGTPGTIDSSLLSTMPEGTKLAEAPASPTASGDSGGLLGAAAAAALGAGSTATFGLTDKLAREVPYVLGGPEASKKVTDQLRLVRERNPGSTLAGEFGGLLANPEAIGAIGESAAAPVAARVGEGLLAGAAKSAARLGAETAAMGAQHAITEESLGDHDLNAQAIWSQAAKEGLLGAAGGGVLGLSGGLLGKATGAVRGLLPSRSGPLSAATLDEVAGGIEGAGRSVHDNASRAEATIEGLRATGATTDQAVDAVQGLDMAAKARAESGIGSGLVDQAADAYADMIGSKTPERAELLRQHYADSAKPIEAATSSIDRTALDMRKSGTSVLRNIEDTANDAQFTLKPERFAKLVDPSRVDVQMDAIASLLQDSDRMLENWETTASKGGLEGGIKKLRRQWTDFNDAFHNFGEGGGSPELSRDLFIKANRFKQLQDSYVPYGRAAGALIDGKATFYGLPEATRDIAEQANKWRSMLENEGIWGDAGAAQARENASFSEMKSRFEHFKDQLGVSIDQQSGVRIPEIDYSKVRGVLDKVTGNPEVDEALQPIISARRTIDGMRDRIAALRAGGELTESQTAKLAQGEKDLASFEGSLNGAMKEAAKANRLKAAVLEEGHAGVGGLVGVGTDMVTRPLKTMQRLAQIKHTYEKVTGGLKSAFREVTESGGSSTEGVAARATAPRPKEKVIEEMQSIRAIAGNPAALEQAAARMTGDLSSYAPQTANALRLTAMRALLYLAREAPPASISTTGAFGAPKARYSDVQIHDWEAKRQAAMNPADVLQDMKHGRLNRDAITTAKFVAPQMYAMMQDLARKQIADLESRGLLDRMPYQQKAVIASLLEVPADRTFEPDFVAMMQAAMQQPAPAPAAGPKKPGGGGGSPAPAKPPLWLQTESQRIEMGGM